ncbi:MAG: hypothetical protein WD046_14065 [Paracoccaceae bacterium]
MLYHLSHSQHHCAQLRHDSAYYNIRDAAGRPFGQSAHMRADLGLDHDLGDAPAPEMRRWRGWRIGLRWPVYFKRIAN